MKYLLEFERDVVTRDGYSIEVDVANQIEAKALAERMATEMDSACPDEACEVGPVECDSWEVTGVKLANGGSTIAASTPPMPANDTLKTDACNTLTLPAEVWEGLLRAAETGYVSLGMEDRDAIAGVAALRLHVATAETRISNAR